MTDLTDVLHRATDDLAPEAPDLLLTRAVRRGSTLRRRRRVTTAASSVAGLAAAAAVVAVVLSGSPGTADSAQVTDLGPTTSPTSTATTPPAGPRVTVARSDFGATFARIVPGTITREHDVPAQRVHEKGGYESTFLWNGYRVALAMWPYAGDSRTACDRSAKGSLGTQTCVRVKGAWSVHDSMMDDENNGRWAAVLRDNGFRVWVMVSNTSADKGSFSAAPPPLDVPDLERVATSDLWFDQGKAP